jgi:AAA domain-containing protein
MATPVPSKTPPASPQSRPAVATPKPPVAAKPPAKSRLDQIKKAKLGLPPRVLIYGPEGVGKTSLAADAGALFADIEGGSGQLEVQRYPFNPGEHDEFKPRDYGQVCECVEDLIGHPGHGFPAFAIDTGDALEALIHTHLCKQAGVSSVEKIGGGYGKGYRAAVEELRRFLSRLDVLRAQGVMIIILAHSVTSTFKNPEGEDFDRYQLKVNDSKNASFAGQLKEWCEVVGFLHFAMGSKKIEDDGSREKRARGWMTSQRLLELAREAAWDAKWRLIVPMPTQIEIGTVRPWAPLADAIARERNQAAPISDQIMAELNRIGRDEFTTAAGNKTTRASVIEMLSTADAPTLSRVLSGLAATPTPES